MEPDRQPSRNALFPSTESEEKRVKVGLKAGEISKCSFSGQPGHTWASICTFRLLVWFKNRCVFTEVQSSVWLWSSRLEVWPQSDSLESTRDNGHWRVGSCCQGAVFKKNKRGSGGGGAGRLKPSVWALPGSESSHYSSLPDSSPSRPHRLSFDRQVHFEESLAWKKKKTTNRGDRLQSFFFPLPPFCPRAENQKLPLLINLHFALIFMCI